MSQVELLHSSDTLSSVAATQGIPLSHLTLKATGVSMASSMGLVQLENQFLSSMHAPPPALESYKP